MGICTPRERVLKEEHFLHIQKLSYGWGWGELWKLVVKCNSGGSEAKTENASQKSLPNSTSQQRSGLLVSTCCRG